MIQEIDIENATIFKLQYPTDEFNTLKNTIDWYGKYITIYGKRILQPRLISFYGDSNIKYKYSNSTLTATPWNEILLDIKKNLFDILQIEFNCVLLNYYRDGKDSIGFHSDNERSLGDNPTIVSLSFGGTRTMIFKNDMEKHFVELNNRDILIMMDDTQKNWLHGIEKENTMEPRINLTFRNIIV